MSCSKLGKKNNWLLLKGKIMKDTEVNTVGDLIQFLSQFDPNKKVMIYDNEWGGGNPLEHIDVEDDSVIFYD